MPDAALDGMRVLDLTSGVSGPYATKLLADHGADVLKVEPPGGDPARAYGPFFRHEPHPEGSARFLVLNTNKRTITLDLDHEEAQDIVRRLAADIDVVLEDFHPGRLAELGLGYDVLEKGRPGIVLVSITPWGQSGPYVDYRQTDIVAQAMGGPMLWTGSDRREPTKLGGELAMYQAGSVAALATMMAFYRQELTDEGDHIDLSIFETQIGSRDRAAPYLTAHGYNGVEPKRHASGTALASGVRPTQDGYINLNAAAGSRLTGFLQMIGREELIDDERLSGPATLVDPALVEEIEASYLGWLMQRTKHDAVAEGQQAHALAGAINTTEDLIADPHYRGRGVWETIDHPHTGTVEYPGRPFVLSETPRAPAERAPMLGEHSDDVLESLGFDAEARDGLRTRGVVDAPGRGD